MIPLRNLFHTLIKATTFTFRTHLRYGTLLLFLLTVAWGTSAQTVAWNDSFEQGKAPTPEQCQTWSGFLNQLAGKSFVSVKISGSLDATGFTISDPAAANQLATLLTSRTPGSVISGGNTWTVTTCFSGACGEASTALAVNGDTQKCSCSDRYAIRPHSINEDWGGLNVSSSCKAPSQSMSLVFNSGVSILITEGSTTLCEGKSVVLTANAEICGSSLQYLWSTGETTRSITVSKPGSYNVKVSGTNGCSGISQDVIVRATDVKVEAGADQIHCSTPVQLNATGTSTGGPDPKVNEICVYDAPSMIFPENDNCTFQTDMCLNGGVFIGSHNNSYSTVVSLSSPVELRYKVYYSPIEISTFIMKLNDQQLGSYRDIETTQACAPTPNANYPRTFTFDENAIMKYWKAGADNKITVEIVTPNNGVYLGGIKLEILTSEEKYLWSPVAGLSNPFIQSPTAAPLASTAYSVTYTDANGCSATDVVNVAVNCGSAPVASCQNVTKELGNSCEVTVDASEFNKGSTGAGPLKFSVSPAGPYTVGITNVTLTVTDVNGATSTCSASVEVLDNVAPTIATPADITALSVGACSAEVPLVAPEASDNCKVVSITHDQENFDFPVGETIVTWTAKDASGNAATTTQKITVTNGAPVITSLVVENTAVELNNPLTLSVSHYDNNSKTASIDWGDMSMPLIVNNPGELITASHTYSTAGYYTVTVTIEDYCGLRTSQTADEITAFDRGISVEGDGWFDSKAGYYLKDKRAAGKAQFHFKGEYKKTAFVPTGSITFKFKAGKIDFRSSQLESLVANDNRAMLKGSGKLNGVRGYSILVSMLDDNFNAYGGGKDDDDDDDRKKDNKGKGKKSKKADKIRVKIWDPAGYVIYDTQHGDAEAAIATTDIGGGAIRFKKTSSFIEQREEAIANFGNESSSVYPNPFIDNIRVQFNSSSPDDVVITLMDLSGKVIVSLRYEVSDDGYYSLEIPEETRGGIYILIIKQGTRVEYLRAVRK